MAAARRGDQAAIGKVQEAILWWTLESALDAYGIYHGAPPEDPADLLGLSILWPMDTSSRPWAVVTSPSSGAYPRVVVNPNAEPFANWRVQASRGNQGTDARFGSWHSELERSTTPAGRRYWQERFWEQLDAPSAVPFAEPLLMPLIAYRMVYGNLHKDPYLAFKAFRIGLGDQQVDRLLREYPDTRYWRDNDDRGAALELRRGADRWLLVWEDRPVATADEGIYWVSDPDDINDLLRGMKPWTVVSQINVPTVRIPNSRPGTIGDVDTPDPEPAPVFDARDIRTIESRAQRTLDALADAQENFRDEDPGDMYGTFRDLSAYEYIEEGYGRGNMIPHYSLAVFFAGDRQIVSSRRRIVEPYYVIVAAP
ncbi:MAG TPA: hypothetical protein VEI97_10325, partial [bacterium]|nr:hypothetical protein [bacterium]